MRGVVLHFTVNAFSFAATLPPGFSTIRFHLPFSATCPAGRAPPLPFWGEAVERNYLPRAGQVVLYYVVLSDE
jgi:hypothetical protein